MGKVRRGEGDLPLLMEVHVKGLRDVQAPSVAIRRSKVNHIAVRARWERRASGGCGVVRRVG